MTISDTFDLIALRIKQWQAEEIVALSRKDAQHARDCRRAVGLLEQLAHDLRELAKAAA